MSIWFRAILTRTPERWRYSEFFLSLSGCVLANRLGARSHAGRGGHDRAAGTAPRQCGWHRRRKCVALSADTDMTFTEDRARFRACGWQAIHVEDGIDPAAIETALSQARAQPQRPSLLLIARTSAAPDDITRTDRPR